VLKKTIVKAPKSERK